MGTTGKLPAILSLSAASLALLQSILPSKGQSADASIGNPGETLNGQMTSKTDRVLLEPPHQKDLLRLYAGHSSHSSHSSHASGMGHSSHYSATTYTVPVPATAPVYPTYTPAPAQPVTRPIPAPVKPAPIETNTPPVSV